MNRPENKIHVIKERSKVIFEIPKIITPPCQYDYTTRQVVAQSLFFRALYNMVHIPYYKFHK